MKIYIASDHAGFELKSVLSKELKDANYELVDCGAETFEPSDDYPDFIAKVAEAVQSDQTQSQVFGIVIGGSGQGEAMVANRTSGIRAAVFYGPVAPKQAIDIEGELTADPYAIVRLERLHNNANVLSIGARFVSVDEAKNAVKVFLTTSFSENERHVRRISKF